MNTPGSQAQVQFFLSIKAVLPLHASLVEEVSEVLGLSVDSAYRRISGKKELEFCELQALSEHFNISVDQFFNLSSNSILFQGKLNNNYRKDGLKLWMEDMLNQLVMVNDFSHKHIYFFLKDIPPFYHFYHPELLAFKAFFWEKSILLHDKAKHDKFSLDDPVHHQYLDLAQKILKIYNKTPTSEIWNEEGLNTTLRQISAYHEMGLFKEPSDALKVCKCVLEVIDHLEHMADTGKKFMPGAQTQDGGRHSVYLNEIVLGDNTFMAEVGDTKITFLNHSVIYFLGSRDKTFNEQMFKNLKNLMKRSTLISETGEKERRLFFNRLRKKVHAKISELVSSQVSNFG